jgi:hypothetical protein
MRTTNRALPVLATILAVAALILGAGWLRALTTSDSTTATDRTGHAAVTAVSAPGPNDLDLGAATQDDVATCLSPDFATDPSQVDMLYGVRQRRIGGSVPVLVLRNAAGDVRLCDQFGIDSPSQAPLATVSSARPIAFLSNGRSDWSCAGTSRVLDRFQSSTWLVVSSEVATVEQRYLVDGVAGPWFTTKAQGGYAHLETWLQGPEPAGTKLAQQFRVLDASGNAVRQTALPARATALTGCSAGGSAQIG